MLEQYASALTKLSVPDAMKTVGTQPYIPWNFSLLAQKYKIKAPKS